MKFSLLNAGVVRFRRLGNCAQSFHPHETFPDSLLLDTCKDYIFADVSPYLINTNFHDISIESGRM